MLGALAELPASTDTDGLMIQTGDLVAATELAGLERPTEPEVDAVASWIFPLTGLPRDDTYGPLFVPLGQVFNYQYLRSIAEFDAALGWSLVDADAFVEQSTPPESFAVITGDFDETTLNPDLTEVADGVVSYGEGEDFETNLSGGVQPRRSARPAGAPRRGRRPHRRVVQHPVRAGVARRARTRRSPTTRHSQPWPRRSMEPTSSPPS